MSGNRRPYWCAHHEPLITWYTLEEYSNRFQYILKHKPRHELAIRVKAFVPVLHPELLPSDVRDARLAVEQILHDYLTRRPSTWNIVRLSDANAVLRTELLEHWAELNTIRLAEYPEAPAYERSGLIFPSWRTT